MPNITYISTNVVQEEEGGLLNMVHFAKYSNDGLKRSYSKDKK